VPSIAEVFMVMRLRPDQLKRDAEEGLKKVDATAAGAKAGAEFGEAFKRGADGKLRDSKGRFISDANAAAAGVQAGAAFGTGFKRGADGRLRDLKGRFVTDAEAAASGDRAGRSYGFAFGRKARSEIEKQLKAIRGPGTGLLGVGGRGGAIAGGVGVAGGLLPAALALGGGGILGLLGLGAAGLGAKTLIGTKDTGATTASVAAALAAANQRTVLAFTQAQARATTPQQRAAARVTEQQSLQRNQLVAQQAGAKVGPSTQGPLFAQAQQVGAAFTTALRGAALSLVPALTQAMSQIIPLIQSLAGPLGQVFGASGTLIGPLVTGLGKLAQDTLPLLAQAFTAVAPLIKPILGGFDLFVTAILPALTTLLKAASPAFTALAVVLGALGKAVAAIVTGIAPGLSASSALFETLGKVILILAPVLAQMAVILAQSLAPAFAAIAVLLVALAPTFVALLKAVLPFLGGVLVNFANGLLAISKLIGKFPDWLKLVALGFIALGIAMRLAAAGNPWVLLITAIIVAIGFLVTHVDLLKRIWDVTWGAIKAAAKAAWDFIWNGFGKFLLPLLGPVGLLALGVIEVYKHWNTILNLLKRFVIQDFIAPVVNAFLTFVGTIIHAVASAFGWIPGLGGKLHDAAHAFDVFHAQVNASLAAITKSVNVDLTTSGKGQIIISGTGINTRTINTSTGQVRAIGGHTIRDGLFISRGAGPRVDDFPALLAKGELVVPEHLVAAGTVDHLRGHIPGFTAGGLVGGRMRVAGNAIGTADAQWAELAAQAFALASVQAAKKAAAAAAAAVASGFVGGPAASGTAAAAQRFAQSILPAGWSWPALLSLWNQESGWNAWAVNPSSGAYGIPQSLGHGHPYNLGDYANQVRWGIAYIAGRYGSSQAAWGHEQGFNWYKDGGWVNEPVIGVGLHSGQGYGFAENGPEYIGKGGGRDVHIHFDGLVVIREEADIDLLAQKLGFAIAGSGLL